MIKARVARGKLAISAGIKYLLGAALVALLVFLPAGTLRFWQGWLLMAVLFVPMLILGTVLLVKSPELLEKRLASKEKQRTQQAVVKFSGLMFLCGFTVSGLAPRLGWRMLPGWVSVAAAVVFLVSYGLYGEVMRENVWLSRTVEVREGQQVVDTGLYGIVRHPMYAVTVPLFLSIPLILGSLWGFLIFCVYPLLLVLRIRNEEEVLERELEGYSAYKTRVKYRMIPYLW